MPADSVQERWRRLFGTDPGIEMRVPGDPDRILVRAWLGARIGYVVPAWLELPALPSHEPGARERGPLCPGCAVPLDRTEPLRACTACLTVEHRDCQLARGGCACGVPAGSFGAR